jgi:hypothetical protein
MAADLVTLATERHPVNGAGFALGAILLVTGLLLLVFGRKGR